MATLIVVQGINTTWTKRSRGAPQAALRARVPVAVTVPTTAMRSDEPTLLVHEVHYTESNAFLEPVDSSLRCQPLAATLHLHNLALVWETGRLRVDLAWENGAPWRRFGHQIITLERGQWGRVRLNYRTAGEDFWRYDQWVLNIGVCGELELEVFHESAPLKDYADLVDLW